MFNLIPNFDFDFKLTTLVITPLTNMAPTTDSKFDDEKQFLMLLVLNADIKITEACKQVGAQMGVKPETLR